MFTIYACIIQQHDAHSMCCAAIPTSSFLDFAIIPVWNSAPVGHWLPTPATDSHYTTLDLWTSVFGTFFKGIIQYSAAILHNALKSQV